MSYNGDPLANANTLMKNMGQLLHSNVNLVVVSHFRVILLALVVIDFGKSMKLSMNMSKREHLKVKKLVQPTCLFQITLMSNQ
jgi:hypothetical protein